MVSGKSFDTLITRVINVNGVPRKFVCREGTSDGEVVRQVFDAKHHELSGIPEWEGMKEFLSKQRSLKRRPLIVDCGANIGATAIRFISEFPDARIVAIEPEESNIEMLRLNCSGLEVTPIAACVGSSSGVSELIDTGMHYAFRTKRVDQFDPQHSGGLIPRVTIKDIYANNVDCHVFPFIVKVDIEGSESDFFFENHEWVSKTPIMIVELHDWLIPGVSKTFWECVGRYDLKIRDTGNAIVCICNSALVPKLSDQNR